MRKAVPMVLAVAVLGVVVFAFSSYAPPRTTAKVTRVVDGGTILVKLMEVPKEYSSEFQVGQVVRVRYIDPLRPVEGFGRETSAANEALVEGETVYLELDAQLFDRYHRLGYDYVYLDPDGRGMVDAVLVPWGFANASLRLLPNERVLDAEVKLESMEREGERIVQELRERMEQEGLGPWHKEEASAAAPPAPCDCVGLDLDCADFATQAEAQACRAEFQDALINYWQDKVRPKLKETLVEGLSDANLQALPGAREVQGEVIRKIEPLLPGTADDWRWRDHLARSSSTTRRSSPEGYVNDVLSKLDVMVQGIVPVLCTSCHFWPNQFTFRRYGRGLIDRMADFAQGFLIPEEAPVLPPSYPLDNLLEDVVHRFIEEELPEKEVLPASIWDMTIGLYEKLLKEPETAPFIQKIEDPKTPILSLPGLALELNSWIESNWSEVKDFLKDLLPSYITGKPPAPPGDAASTGGNNRP